MSSLENTQVLLDWGREAGIYVNPKLMVPAVFPPGYVGVKAIEPIMPRETLLTVPNSALLSTKVTSPAELQEIYNAHQELFSSTSKEHEDYKMIAYILWELKKGENSFWASYFKSLPSTPDNMLDWTVEDLAELQDPALAFDISVRVDKDKECNKIFQNALLEYPNIFDSENASMEKITWAWRIIVTRSFGRVIPFPALIPIADLLNHDNCKTSYYYGSETDAAPDYHPDGKESDEEDDDEEIYESPLSILLSSQKLHRVNFGAYGDLNADLEIISKQIAAEAKKLDARLFVNKLKVAERVSEVVNLEESEDKRFRMVTAKDKGYEAGDQAYIPYGRYSNRMLLTNYGFALAENYYNYARLKFFLKEILSPPQLEKLTQHYNENMIIAFKFKKQYLNTDFLGILRGLLWNYQLHESQAFFSPTNYQLEIESLTMMKNLISRKCEEFPTTLEADKAELAQTCISRRYFALLYRIGVKECLNGQILLINIAVKIIERLANSENLADALKLVPEFENENSNIHIDFAYHRKGLKEYTDKLQVTS